MKPYGIKVAVAVAVQLFAHAILSADPALYCPQGQLCLTSFKQCDNSNEEACRAPPGSYPWIASPSYRSSDEDQRTWCVVCLEDGTVHCLGCDAGDDVYCARCWKEMHVGPRAGYDERGHSWETLARRPR
ncbi:hypothetical protein NUW58_g1984 [Xylaria curta]|uniref:Uncharacterized protein n=1 Tax=Xylaria curta TaxID=42375 RepID=A0ACC1PJ45_9PEZI|nr:hypothetical protein NUW58_g1984 [Xylaria curta]